MNVEELKPVVEALLMVADGPLTVERLGKLLDGEGDEPPTRGVLHDILRALQEDYAGRGIELAEVASGWRFRARAAYAPQIGRLWEERRPRYTRAFLETLAIIAYRQPITRGEIEHIRGVAVSSNIMRQLLEREWVKVVGHRDVPGRPSVYATTRELLDYFGLKSLSELPTLAELKDIDDFNADLFGDIDHGAELDSAAATDVVDVDGDGAAVEDTDEGAMPAPEADDVEAPRTADDATAAVG